MNYRSPLARARGLGSAGVGSHEWWRQRVTSVALVPLILWIAPAVALLPGAAYRDLLDWFASPWNGIVLLSFICTVFYHAVLGLQVVIEDYVHTDGLKFVLLLGMKLVYAFLALAAVYAALRLSLHLLFAD